MPPLGASGTVTQVGNYEIVAKLAEGGMGTVYKARHRDTGLVVAVKIVPPTTARNPVLMQRFEREFQAAHLLDHPHIVKAIEYNASGPSPFLVMEFVDGESLGQKIEREGRMPEAEAVRVISQVAQGLHKAHQQGMVHRDVKPDNVMLTRDGVAKLTDLGLVKDAEGELNLTKTGRGLGTPHFMAPEQFRNAKNADARCDIYSLAATLYMLVTGEMPFAKCGPLDAWMKKVNNDFPSPRDLVPGVSERVDWAVRRSMSGDPDKRPATCREFLEDLVGQSGVANPLTAAQVAAQIDLWYLVYKDEEGQTHTVKGNTEAIRRALREGLLGDAGNIRAARSKMGPFQPLRGFAEFRDLIITPAPLPPAVTPTRTTPTRPTPASSGPIGRAAVAAPAGRHGGDEAVDFGGPLAPDGSSGGGHSKRRLSSTPSGSGRMAQPHSGTGLGKQGSGRLPDAKANASASGKIPHIPMDTSRDMPQWLVWLIALAVALATTFTAFYFLQQLPRR